ncbi:MarR family transcriptional regulator [Pusillimonas sp. CC-YST705]|uniref:MarR family transcriptional regulator n=1 Tax=Mesopusillimonas faecipullorum TaxID=2755040 RepID=A0ABS8CFH8_9BURK|nr:MarR family transcriptional regulator [Mesopusillimonas faecipullorum]MCB5364795.1 MarR family transcriptional regulator [Mesopusillimonas faecipullorum]
MTDQSLPLSDSQTVDQAVLLQSIGYSCLQTYLAIVPELKKQLATLGLRPVEYTILSVVKRNSGITQKRLGETIKVSPPNLATVLDRMEQDGLLARQRNPLDKRSQVLVLHSRGTLLCDQAEAVVAEAEALPQLSEAERHTLLGLLQKIFLPTQP